MLPKSLQDRELLKEIIAQRHQQSSMNGAVSFFIQEIKGLQDQAPKDKRR